MENFEDLYSANMLSQIQESRSHAHEVGLTTAAAAAAAYYDSRVPSDRTQEALASRNVALERNRRDKLNQKLCQLRAAVPTISKMNKASTIKDAIEYIQSLLEQERIIQAEISELENGKPTFDFDQDGATFCHRPNTPTIMNQYCCDSATIISSPVEVRELRVLDMGEKTVVVTLECNKGTDTIIKLCEIFESLKLKITTANITAFPGRLLKTVFLEADDEEKKVVRAKIEAAIAALNYPHSPMSTSKY
ncbi:transcription factor bHLH35-like [Primulina eburnea]|uniref:transcription factor bHLH35-like n=1 Tax=Primulina eburnea TaxID=1245227 RepID=UPI003C6BDA29